MKPDSVLLGLHPIVWSVHLLTVLGQSQPGAVAAHGKGYVVFRSALLYTPAPLVMVCIWAEVMKNSEVSKFAVVGLVQISALLQGDCQWF